LPVRLFQTGDKEILVTGDIHSSQDHLAGIPII